jgi:hypothetical protein
MLDRTYQLSEPAHKQNSTADRKESGPRVGQPHSTEATDINSYDTKTIHASTVCALSVCRANQQPGLAEAVTCAAHLITTQKKWFWSQHMGP